MKTNVIDRDMIRFGIAAVDACDDLCSLGNAHAALRAVLGSKATLILADLDRLAEIEAARGGLTEEERKTAADDEDVSWTGKGIMSLDDALRATTAELEKVRGMLRECVLTLRDHGVRNGYNDRIDAARAYLAETEVSDDR